MNKPESLSEDALHAFVDGRLSPAAAAHIEERMKSDPQLHQRIEAWRSQSALLRDAFAFKMEEACPARLNIEPVAKARPGRKVSWPIAAGFALLFLLGGIGGWTLSGFTRPDELTRLTWLATLAYDSAQIGAPMAVDYGPERRGALVAWMSERFKRPLQIPDLDAVGYRFAGGRASAGPLGPSALLIYRNGAGQELVIYYKPMSGRHAARRQIQIATGGGFAWIDDHLGYTVMAADNAALVRAIDHIDHRGLT